MKYILVPCFSDCIANIASENNHGRTALQEAEFGHYHYCLLVFAAFEQIKTGEKDKEVEKTQEEVQEVDMADKKEKRYDRYGISVRKLETTLLP